MAQLRAWDGGYLRHAQVNRCRPARCPIGNQPRLKSVSITLPKEVFWEMSVVVVRSKDWIQVSICENNGKGEALKCTYH